MSVQAEGTHEAIMWADIAETFFSSMWLYAAAYVPVYIANKKDDGAQLKTLHGHGALCRLRQSIYLFF